MLSTIILFAVLIGGLIVSVALWAFCLRLGLRWAKVEDVTSRRVLLTTIVVLGLELAANVLLRLSPSKSDEAGLLVGVGGLAATLAVPCVVIMLMFKIGFFRAVQSWLPTLLASLATALLALLVVRPFVFEAFATAANSMAPTLLGERWEGLCPECGQPNYCSPIVADHFFGTPQPAQRICGSFHVSPEGEAAPSELPADRFLAAKYLEPRRWDVVAFRSPEDRSTRYVKRLVGLPGEEILIRDGAVWADGKKLTPPASIRGIRYLGELPEWPAQLWGSPERPAQLGPDEYFVLGDFSAQSRDSRFWGQGAEGHNPFAVPASHLCGVVTHIYWPPSRWRILR
jgi:signal peptidase I